ncbi:NAD(P)H-dependent glycerol-3-phosphate dehydrogenase [Thermocrinis sp.]
MWKTVNKITILGGGRWGTALGLYLSKKGFELMFFDRNPAVVESLRKGKDPYWELEFAKNPRATSVLDEAIEFSDLIVVALPVQVIREVLQNLVLKDKVIVSASKGLEVGSSKRVSQIIEELCIDCKTFVLSGPSFAEEVAKGLPCAVVLAGKDLETLRQIRDVFHSEVFRVYLSEDMVGVELGGALKNVIAIACGISDGLGFGDNARASLITRGLAEIVRIGSSLGGNRETFYGLSGLGDLVLTSTSSKSRNRTFGFLLGQGLSVEEAENRIKQVVEGKETVKAVKKLTEELNIYAPISWAVYQVVVEKISPELVARNLLLRPPQREFEYL